jgi:hypothetical protein
MAVFLQKTNLLDIVEVRPGTHSYGFVGTMSTDKHREVTKFADTLCRWQC